MIHSDALLVVELHMNFFLHKSGWLPRLMGGHAWAIRIAVASAMPLLAGCSNEWYRQSADRQVESILKERKQETVGYTPVSDPSSAPAPKAAPQKAYAKLPVTPIPPEQPSPIEPRRGELPFGPLSPEMTFPAGVSAPAVGQDVYDPTTSQRRNPPRRWVLGPPSPDDASVRLDLFKSLEYAVQHSRVYQSQMEELYLTTLDVTLQRHLFEPRFFANTSLTYRGGQQDVDYRSALVAAGNAGVRQKLPYGGEIVASGLVQFIDALNDSTENGESAQVALSATIPLLRGAGMVNLESLINSERQLVYQVRRFEEYRRGFAVDVATSYFRILTSQQAVLNRRKNYRNLTDLLERTKALYAAGKINFLEVQRSSQAVYSAENTLIDAEASLENTVDDFKLQIGMDVETDLLVLPVAIDVTVPDVENRDVVKVAHRYRLDVQTAKDSIDDANRRVQVAANGLEPDLDIVANTAVGNRVDTPASRLDGRTNVYSAGVQLDLPVDRLAERNSYRTSLIGLDRAKRNLQELLESVAADVRTRIRAIRSAQASLSIQQRSIELATRRLDYANELLQQGKVNSRDVVEAQQALLGAQDAYESARSNLQIEILRFLRDTGTLRVDPRAGSLGRAMDRLSAASDGLTQPIDKQ